MIFRRSLTQLGGRVMAMARDVGGVFVLTMEVLRALIPPRLDGRETMIGADVRPARHGR